MVVWLAHEMLLYDGFWLRPSNQAGIALLCTLGGYWVRLELCWLRGNPFAKRSLRQMLLCLFGLTAGSIVKVVDWRAFDFAFVDFKEFTVLQVVLVLCRELLSHLLDFVLAWIVERGSKLLLLVCEKLEDRFLTVLVFLMLDRLLIVVTVPINLLYASI